MISAYEHASIAELAQGCRQETARFRSGKPGPAGFCFELFRRAVVEHSQEAWEALYVQYRGLMLRWAGGSAWDAEDLIQCAFENFTKAITPKRFAHFAGIATVLGYLRRCVCSIHINRQRQKKREQAAIDALRANGLRQTDPPEQAALNHIVNQQLADHIYGRLKDEQERLVVYLNFELELKPADIARRHPDKFPSAHDVSRIKERVLRRLSQDPILRDRFSADSENPLEKR